MIDLSIVTISFNTKSYTLETIESVYKNTKGISFEMIVIDNNSEDGSVAAIRNLTKKFKTLKFFENDKNIGFGAGNNQGAKVAKGRYILFLNSDTNVHDNTLKAMVDWMDKHPKAGIASCGLKSKDGSFQGTGGYFPTLVRVFAWMTFIDDIPLFFDLFKPFHPMHALSPFGSNEKFYKTDHLMDWVTGAFFMVRRKVVSEAGYFDEDYFMYVEETDYCFRAKKKNWQVWYLPRYSIIHYGGASSNSEYALVNEIRGIKTFYKKNMPDWQYPFLVIFIKLGAILRILIFGILKGGSVAKTYAKILVSV